MALVDLSKIPQRAIIIAAGEGTRWDNYLGVAKHFIEIDGEPIIKRTIRLLKENGIDDIWVVSKQDDAYKLEGSQQFIPQLDTYNDGVDKFLNSKELWLDDGHTIILYGDVYFTERAMQRIATHNHRDWQLFARPMGSELTGCPWGECFAISFYEDHIPEQTRTLEKSVRQWHKGMTRRPSGWQFYRYMIGLDGDMVDQPFFGDRLVTIYDFTDDFDVYLDYDKFMEQYEWAKKNLNKMWWS